MCAGSHPEDARSDTSARSVWCFLFTINFAVKMFHSGLSPFYWSCVMCAPSLRDAVIAAVPVPFTERVGPDTHSSCIYLQFPLIWFDLRSKPVVIKTGFRLQNTARRGTRAKIQGKPWWSAMALRRAHGRAGAERSGLLSSGSLWWGWKRHLGCQLSVSRIFIFFSKPSVAKKKSKCWHMVNILLTLSRVF